MCPRRFIQILDAFIAHSPANQNLAAIDQSHSTSRPEPPRSYSDSTPAWNSTAPDIPQVQAGQSFVTPSGQRQLQIVRFVGGGKRAKVYQAIELGNCQSYALKVVHDSAPGNLESMGLETVKADALASHQLPHARIIEMGITYVLKEWIDGIAGDHWLCEWMKNGADPTDPAFLALVRFFGDAAAKGVHVNDLKPANMILRSGTEWLPVDPGLVTASVAPAVAMKSYRERFIRRWLRVSRSPFWYMIYWAWCQVRRANREF